MKVIVYTFLLFFTLTSWSKDISVVSFNVEWLGHGNKKRTNEDVAKLGKYIKSLDFSIICLQEVHPSGSVDGDGKSDYREILAILGDDYRGWYSPQGGGQRLVFIWNKKEVEVSDLGLLAGFKREAVVNGDGKTFPRIPFTCFVKSKTTGVDFRLITVHMTWGKNKARYQEASRLAKWYEDYKGESLDKDVVLIGDFNSKTMDGDDPDVTKSKTIMNTKSSGLICVSEGDGEFTTPTSRERYDHGFISKDLKDEEYGKWDVLREKADQDLNGYKKLSNHCPVVITIKNDQQDNDDDRAGDLGKSPRDE